MKKIILCLTFALCAWAGFSQTKVKQDKQGNYIAVGNARTTSYKDTGKKFTDREGKSYPVYINSTGKLFIFKVSKKTGKSYKQYLKLEN